MKFQLGFIGAGNMAEAIARAAIDAKVLPAQAMIAADPVAQRRDVFNALGIATVEDGREVMAQAQNVLLAVKPQSIAGIGSVLSAIDAQEQVIISIVAGLGTQKLAAATGKPARVVRVMPNTPLQVGLGMAGICLGQHARPGDETLAMKLFGSAGRAVVVAESLMDAVTAVSGSGPAYLFYVAEAMEKAAADLGLGAEARTFVSQTLMGAAHLLAQSSDTAAELRRKVTSPGGTTEAAIKHLEANRVGEVFCQAVQAAAHRSRELG